MKVGKQIGTIQAKKSKSHGFGRFPLRASRSSLRVTTTRIRMRVSPRAFALERERWRNTPVSSSWKSGKI